MGAEPALDDVTASAWAEVARWRQGQRQRLIAERLAVAGETRQRHAALPRATS